MQSGIGRRALALGLLAVAGVTLFGLAVLDWVGYTGFSISLFWR